MTAVDDVTPRAGSGDGPGSGLDDAGLVGALHRRNADLVAGHRASDTKAGLLLAVVGVFAPSLSRMPIGPARGVGAGLALAGVLLVLVLVPRTGGWLRPAVDVDTTLRRVADRESLRELAVEYERLGRITARKHALIRAALLVLAATPVIALIAASIP
ncbi:hypothetical protein [Embleya hyalina]|uniref:Pycsar effector protein domain-containing protein n=1 Tax=Embleya hyalina TaxID=516124 RepID=A0A401YYP5_9ACTN|nr:hypothetical protein [Embleya hyalina]GCD99752.1 hypothetical protein EHYA_07474 [Embleya hyalina]